jgi:predicted AAA+ superfamily ATPase
LPWKAPAPSGRPPRRGSARRPVTRLRRAQLDGYIQRVIDKDFPELGHQPRNPAALRRWMLAYAAATATATSWEKVRDAATSGESEKPARTTVMPYRDVLERLYVLDPLPGWRPTRNHIKRLTERPASPSCRRPSSAREGEGWRRP